MNKKDLMEQLINLYEQEQNCSNEVLKLYIKKLELKLIEVLKDEF